MLRKKERLGAVRGIRRGGWFTIDECNPSDLLEREPRQKLPCPSACAQRKRHIRKVNKCMQLS